MQAEKKAIKTAIEQKHKRLDKLRKSVAEVENKQRELNETMSQIEKLPAVSGNLSIGHLPPMRASNVSMNQAEERYTQWVRATHPYVDGYRAPLIAQFNKWMEFSKLAEHYTKWTNRYTLVKSWQFRSGHRFKKTSDRSGSWSKSTKKDHKPLAMYVMLGAFADTGVRPDRKGHEAWTADTRQGHEAAEKLFTVVGITQRSFAPLFSEAIYKPANDRGITTFAQAIFYNANRQEPEPVGTTQPNQQLVGWDTLNWDPEFATPEWGSPPSSSDAAWPWDIFKKANDAKSMRVRLNWQAKLMPVTKKRLQAAWRAQATQVIDRDHDTIRNLGQATAMFDSMVTH